jgi:hypothetical protein
MVIHGHSWTFPIRALGIPPFFAPKNVHFCAADRRGGGQKRTFMDVYGRLWTHDYKLDTRKPIC